MSLSRPRARAQDQSDEPVGAAAEAEPSPRAERPRRSPAQGGTKRRSEDVGHRADGHASAPGDGAGRRGRASIRTVISEARTQLQELTGRSAEAVTSVERTEEGWRLGVEVLELERIPASTSILGTYDVWVDTEGNLTEYARTVRYHRNQAADADS